VLGESPGSGVVELVELERSESNELMLPQVFEKADEDDEENPDGREPSVNGFVLDRNFRDVCGWRM
jgi:hypothetical protein